MPDSQKIFPVLVYEDIPAAHDFLVAAFGFRPVRLDLAPDGSVVHGEVGAGEVGAGEQTIWLHRVSPEHHMASPRSRIDATGGLAVTVEDVDAHHEHARSAGAVIDYPPMDQPYGRREYGARDPEGHRWWFGTPLR